MLIVRGPWPFPSFSTLYTPTALIITRFCLFQDNPDETFWNKMGTLGRKKKVDEVREVETEGKHAIDSPGMPKSAEMPPEVS